MNPDLRAMVAAFCEDVESEVARRERGPGGQQVPSFGDWVSAPPSTLTALRRQTRAFREVLAAPSDRDSIRREAFEEAARACDERAGDCVRAMLTVEGVNPVVAAEFRVRGFEASKCAAIVRALAAPAKEATVVTVVTVVAAQKHVHCGHGGWRCDDECNGCGRCMSGPPEADPFACTAPTYTEADRCAHRNIRVHCLKCTKGGADGR